MSKDTANPAMPAVRLTPDIRDAGNVRPKLHRRSKQRQEAVMAGSLDDPSSHKPTMDIYTVSAQPWDHMNPLLPKVPKAPQLPGEA